MSMAALLSATASQLQTVLKLGIEECDVTEGGQPPASAGERFVAVSEGEWQSNSYESLDEYYGVTVTVSVRTERVPWDRRGQLMTTLDDKAGIMRLGEAVRAAVHSNYDLMNAANTLLGPDVNGFIEPLRLGGPGRLRPVQASWFQADAPTDGGTDACGLVLMIPFRQARRIQGIENQLLEF